jgi:hypothetical protein
MGSGEPAVASCRALEVAWVSRAAFKIWAAKTEDCCMSAAAFGLPRVNADIMAPTRLSSTSAVAGRLATTAATPNRRPTPGAKKSSGGGLPQSRGFRLAHRSGSRSPDRRQGRRAGAREAMRSPVAAAEPIGALALSPRGKQAWTKRQRTSIRRSCRGWDAARPSSTLVWQAICPSWTKAKWDLARAGDGSREIGQ